MVFFEIDARQMQENNLRSLKRRKNEFRKNLIRSFSTGGYLFIVLLYLKDTSFIRFAVRFVLNSIFTDPFPSQYSAQFTQSTKKRHVRAMYLLAMIMNFVFLISDIITGVPDTPEHQDPYLYGSISLQLIGETKPRSRLAYLYYNLIITGFQMILIYLTAILNVNQDIGNESVLMDGTTYSVNQIEGDGYTGITNVAKIKPKEIFFEVKSYETEQTEDTASEETYRTFMTDRFNINNLTI